MKENRMKSPLYTLLVAFGCLILASDVSVANTISKDPYIGAVVAEASTGRILINDNTDALAYPASVVKLMDLLIYVELIEKGIVKPTDKVKVTAEAQAIGGTQVWLEAGEEFTVDDMLYALMIQSANDVATALAIHIAGTKDGFVKMMNKRAAELGMQYTEFNSVHGLPPSKGQNHDVTTPRDIAILACEAARHPMVLRYTGTKVKKFRNGTLDMRNHNRLLGVVDGCDGLKTGYIRVAGFSLAATVKRDGKRIVAVVMGSKSKKTRDLKARELIETGFSKLLMSDGTTGTHEYLIKGQKVSQPKPAPVVDMIKPLNPEEAEKSEEVAENDETSEPLSKRGPFSNVLAVLLILAAGGATSFLVMRKRMKDRDRDKFHWN